tara:strand:- start:447 stop:710 length:264 start_codon:yes stop_codon:yes gene_type:complete
MKVTILDQPTVEHQRTTYKVNIKIEDKAYYVARQEINGEMHTYIKDEYGSPVSGEVVKVVNALFANDEFNWSDRSQWLADKVFELKV